MAAPTLIEQKGPYANAGPGSLSWFFGEHAVGDIGIAVLTRAGAGAATGALAGLTEISTTPLTSGAASNDTTLQIFWTRFTSAAANVAGPSIPFTTGSEYLLLKSVVYRGCVASGSPIGATDGALTLAANGYAFPSITATGGDSRILLFGSSSNDNNAITGAVNAALSSITTLFDESTTLGSDGSLVGVSALFASPSEDTTGKVTGVTSAPTNTSVYDQAALTLELLGQPTLGVATDVSTAGSIVYPWVQLTGAGVDTSSTFAVAPAIGGTLEDALTFQGDGHVSAWGIAPSDALDIGEDIIRGYIGAPVIEVGFVGTPEMAAALALSLVENAALAPAFTDARGMQVADALHIGSALLPNTKRGLSYTDTLSLVPGLLRYLGGDLTDVLDLTPTTAAKKIGSPVSTEALSLTGVASMDVVLSVTSVEELTLTDTQLVQALLTGVVVENALFSLGALSDSGDFTAWAINTATLGVSEYGNYEFNSYAEFGGRYLGASSSGLYTLDGGSDAGTDVIATLRSGFTQFAGAKLAVLDAAYLGVRGDGDFVFKVVTAEGKTHTYAARVDSMKTAKVTLGRGLRTRYIAFELVSTGQDFDLESVEFSPLDLVRRV